MTRAPLPVRAVGYAWRRSRETLYLLRGKNILRRYSAHYRRARRRYPRESGALTPGLAGPRELGVRVIQPREADTGILLPPDHEALVARVARGAAEALDRSANCRFVPAIPSTSLTERTADIPAVRDGDVITIQLLDPFVIDGLHDLCEPLLRELERKVYGSYAIVDKVYVYRSPVSRQVPSASWLWHFDNHPREMLKVMVYLTDVDEDTAPFEYLRERSTGRPLYGAPLAPRFGHSRVAVEEIGRLEAAGWERRIATGPRGTVLVFDDNIVHRATLARSAHRDVIVFQVRPADFKAVPHIDPRWTGTFLDHDVNTDPRDLAPQRKA